MADAMAVPRYLQRFSRRPGGLRRCGSGRPRYAPSMRTELEGRPARPPILRRAAAGLVLIAAAALAIHLAVGLVVTIFWVAVVLAVAVAVIWALKTIVW